VCCSLYGATFRLSYLEDALGATLLKNPAPVPAFFVQAPTVTDTAFALSACFTLQLLPLQPASCNVQAELL
jgi:hypothetical protein